MRLHAFTRADRLLPPERLARQAQISAEMARVAKASEAGEPAELRRQILDVEDVADALATGGTVEHAGSWSRWERTRFCLVWLGVATIAATVLLLTLEVLAPWTW